LRLEALADVRCECMASREENLILAQRTRQTCRHATQSMRLRPGLAKAARGVTHVAPRAE
jgi:hypothetical protein